MVDWHRKRQFAKVARSTLSLHACNICLIGIPCVFFAGSLTTERQLKSSFSLSQPHNLSYAAPAATALLCLLVISPECLICSFLNLFLNCWHKSEWSRKPRQASVSVAFRATALTKSACFLSGLTRRGQPQRHRLDDAFVNKKEKKEKARVPWVFISAFAPACPCPGAKWLVEEAWEYSPGSHRTDLGHSCGGLWVANKTQQLGCEWWVGGRGVHS